MTLNPPTTLIEETLKQLLSLQKSSQAKMDLNHAKLETNLKSNQERLEAKLNSTHTSLKAKLEANQSTLELRLSSNQVLINAKLEQMGSKIESDKLKTQQRLEELRAQIRDEIPFQIEQMLRLRSIDHDGMHNTSFTIPNAQSTRIVDPTVQPDRPSRVSFTDGTRCASDESTLNHDPKYNRSGHPSPNMTMPPPRHSESNR